MEKTELLESLDTYGHRLSAGEAVPNDVTKALGLALLALNQLMKGPSISDIPSAPNQGAAFKAKGNRW
jgi:hypothetical protein